MYYVTSGRPIKTYGLAMFPIIAILVFCHQTNSLKIYERCKNESTHFLDVISKIIKRFSTSVNAVILYWIFASGVMSKT